MKVYGILLKKSEHTTPNLIKIGIIIGLWILGSGLVKILMNLNLPSVISIIFITAQILSLVAIWNLRKWGIYAAIMLGIIGIAYTYWIAGYSVHIKAISAAIVFRLIPIVPAFIYWKKFNS